MSGLPHTFRDPGLLRLALTHASTGGSHDNERLEFLGDAALDLVVAEELYRMRPERSEGEMTELKAWVVSREVLAGVARRLGLEEAVHLGPGMRARVLPRSVLANLLEALIGAVYLDGGLEAARRLVRTLLSEALESVRELSWPQNPKQMLQQRAQQETGDPPRYLLLRERGDAHARAFLVAAEVRGQRFPSAWGRTRKEAERWAAHEALLVLEGPKQTPERMSELGEGR